MLLQITHEVANNPTFLGELITAIGTALIGFFVHRFRKHKRKKKVHPDNNKNTP